MRIASHTTVALDIALNVTGWRGVRLSWRAFGAAALLIPTLADAIADLEEL